ncbi:hypothetical protein thsps117_42990 [Pseudomonas sp. No.117]
MGFAALNPTYVRIDSPGRVEHPKVATSRRLGETVLSSKPNEAGHPVLGFAALNPTYVTSAVP